MPMSASALSWRGSLSSRSRAGGRAALAPSSCRIGCRTFSATNEAVFGHVLETASRIVLTREGLVDRADRKEKELGWHLAFS